MSMSGAIIDKMCIYGVYLQLSVDLEEPRRPGKN